MKHAPVTRSTRTVTPVTPAEAWKLAQSARTYESFIEEGRVWAREKCAIAHPGWNAPAYLIEQQARAYADMHAPASVRAEFSARKAAERAADFGPSAVESGQFVLGQYGLRRVGR